MSTEPSREELLAQVAALEHELSQRPPSPFTPEVSRVPSPQAGLKTSQAVRPAQLAVSRDLLTRRHGKATPDEILAQITGLKSVIISGVNSAGYGDKRTEFRSLTELRQILNGLEEDLADALGAGGRIRQIRMTTQADKGL